METKQIKSPKYFLAATATGCLVFLSGCFNDNATVPNGGTTASNSRIQGTVQEEDGAAAKRSAAFSGIEAATVIVARMQADGSLQTVSSGEVSTDIHGNFTVETELDGVKDLVVVAKKGVREWKAVVSAEVKKGETVFAQPLTVESSLEAAVYGDVLASQENGAEAGLISYADIALHIDTHIAAAVRSQGSAEAETALAQALKAEARVRSEMLLHATAGASRAQLEKASQAKAKAQTEFEASLHASAESGAGRESAVLTYHQAILNAHADAGITLQAYAKAKEASLQAMVRNIGVLEADAQTALYRRAGELRAIATGASMQVEFKAAGASQAGIGTITAASIALHTSVRGSTTAGDVDSAFSRYNRKIYAELMTEFGAEIGAGIRMFSESAIASQARAELKTSLESSATEEQRINAYTDFYQKMESEAKASLAISGETRMGLMTGTLVLLNMSF